MSVFNEKVIKEVGRLGALPARTSMKALQFANFQTSEFSRIPKQSKFWRNRVPFELRSFGNNQFGNCTRAKQAIAAMRMERIETKNTPEITDDEVIRVYKDMSNRLYGGGDNGAYEIDALSEWRKSDLTFRDTKGRPLTIDAYLRVNNTDLQEIKKALYLSGAHGLAICFNLPLAWSTALSTGIWDIPADWMTRPEYFPNSWGGHSVWIDEYNEFGVKHPTTWGVKDVWISWAGVATYGTECHLVVDSINSWKAKKPNALNYEALKSAVNEVSSQKLK